MSAVDRIWTVYKITGKCGRAYIGITRMSLRSRWLAHKGAARAGEQSALWRYMREKGPDWFVIEPITECYSPREAIACERAMIAVHNTFHTQGGLNKNLGGGGNISGAELSETARAKMRESGKRQMLNPERRSLGAKVYNAMGRPVSPEGHARKLAGLRTAHTPESWAKGAESKRARFADPEKLAEKRHREWAQIEYEKALAYRVGRIRPHRNHPSYHGIPWGNRKKQQEAV